MATIFKMKQHDLLPNLEVVLGFQDPGVSAPADETAAYNNALAALDAALIDVSATFLFTVRMTETQTVVVDDQPMTVIDAPARKLRYTWKGSETAQAGNADGSVTVMYSGTTPMTHPLTLSIPIVFEPSIRTIP